MNFRKSSQQARLNYSYYNYIVIRLLRNQQYYTKNKISDKYPVDDAAGKALYTAPAHIRLVILLTVFRDVLAHYRQDEHPGSDQYIVRNINPAPATTGWLLRYIYSCVAGVVILSV